MAEQEGYVPVFLPDRTVIGKAKIEGQNVVIELTEGNAIQTLMAENLLGMSMVYLNNEARDAVAHARECVEEMCSDASCYKIEPHSHGTCFVGCSTCEGDIRDGYGH